MLIPTVIKKTANGQAAFDLYSRLLNDRIVYCTGEVTQEMGDIITAQLLYLEAEDSKTPITMYVSGPGGSVSSGFQIISIMNYIKCPVSTVVSGCIASMSSVIAASGEKGMRYCLPNTEIMIHSVSSGTHGTIHDMERDFVQTQKTQEKVLNHLAKCTGKKIEKLKKDCERDFWMDENEWLKYGGCDKILEKRD